MNGFETITKIGGYIIVFSVLLELTKMLPLADTLAGQIGLSFLEITNGVVIPVSYTHLSDNAFQIQSDPPVLFS